MVNINYVRQHSVTNEDRNGLLSGSDIWQMDGFSNKKRMSFFSLSWAIDYEGAANKGKRMWGQCINWAATKGEIKSPLEVGNGAWQ